MTVLSDTQFESAKAAASALRDASKGMRVLSSLKWDRAMREPFLKHGKLPAPDYAPVDTTKPREAIAFAREKIHGKYQADHIVMEWLERLCGQLMSTANIIDTRGNGF